jgi:hypothetical protein
MVRGCDRVISDRLSICSFHWRDVPKDLKRELWRTEGIYPDYEEAVDEAVRYLEDQETMRRREDERFSHR